MKKLKYVVLVCCTLLSCLCFSNQVRAQDFVVKAPDEFVGMSVDFRLEDGSTYTTKVGHIYANEMLTYCVEPLKLIGTGAIMVPSDKLDSEMREKLSVISYNGYNGVNRSGDEWYAATQIYIWEALGNKPIVKGFDKYEKYRSEIQMNIENFYKKPSFDSQRITLEKGVEKEILDTNNVLSSFKQLLHQGNASLQSLGDRLVLKSSSNAYSEGSLSYKKLEDAQLGLPIVFQGANDVGVQSIMYPHISRNVEGRLEYRVQSYGYLNFTKRGEVLSSVNTKETPYGNVHQLNFNEDYLKDVKVRVYAREDIKDVWGNKVYDKNQVIDEIVSSTSSVQGKKLLSGKYYVKEIETGNGYVLDDKEYDFAISNTNQEIDIRNILLNNKRSRVHIEFVKRFEEGSLLDLSSAYKDVVFGIYTKNDIYTYQKELAVPSGSLVYVSGIDEKGNLLEGIDLPQGEYYLKELSTNEHFVLDEKQYDFSVAFNHEENITLKLGEEGSLVNELHRNQLKIYKVDAKGNKPLQATFVLYNQNMDEITEFTTDKNGEYVFEGLVDGTYFLQEIEAPEGYTVNGKIQKIKLNKDITYTIKNKKRKVVNASIETNDSGNHKSYELSMLASMVVMYGFIFRKLKL